MNPSIFDFVIFFVVVYLLAICFRYLSKTSPKVSSGEKITLGDYYNKLGELENLKAELSATRNMQTQPSKKEVEKKTETIINHYHFHSQGKSQNNSSPKPERELNPLKQIGERS
jgi:hypothetical protein